MKIAIVRKRYTFHGGAEEFSRSLITALADAGHQVHLFALQWEGLPATGGIHLHRVPVPTFNSALRDLGFALSVRKALRREEFDIIQSHDRTLYQDIYRAGDGCHIEWLRQRWRRTGLSGKLSIVTNPYHWLILALERMIFKGRRFKKIIAISELVKRNIMDNYRVDGRDIEVIYNGVNLERFTPRNRELYRDEIRRRHSAGADDFLVLFVGSGFERKGVRFLLRAVEQVPEPLTVFIVGKGPTGRFTSLTKRQKVVFCGPQKEIHKYYAAADLFVFPSIYEPFGNVHLEALASGLPVITTRQSGASEIIQDGMQGFVVGMPEETERIAHCIRKLMDGERRGRMAEEARRLAEAFSMEAHTERMLQLYTELKDA